ncbi:hypothetical protein ARMSODRAFT_1025313 [Armillaria solidipes]|uniref:Uncharacterized protein n=1 Tax=Armillaria solidipes TaxID=1076256 RepID=A0A2H3BFC8_9AGAR|nr:hypothetical protein ARMSODRAFT_1025313 [Armillaria solidipes]
MYETPLCFTVHYTGNHLTIIYDMSDTDPIDALQQGEETVVVGDNGKTAMEELWEEYNTYLSIMNPQTGENSNASSTAFRENIMGAMTFKQWM